MNRNRTRRVCGVAAVLIMTSACAGPETRINASVKEFPQNIRIGDADTDGEIFVVPLPPLAPLLTGGSAATKPRAGTGPSQPVSARPCPVAGPGATAEVPAGPDIIAAPAAGSYSYRTTGTRRVGGANAEAVSYPKTGTRVVAPRPAPSDPAGTLRAFDFAVTATLGAARTETTYRVVSTGSATSTPVTAGPGLYVISVKTLDSAGATADEFKPQPAMLVMPFPADEGTVFGSSSVDSRDGSSISYSGTVGDHTRVDACGSVIDTRSVRLTGQISIGSCAGAPCPGHATAFEAVYAIATQYGGLSVQDQVVVQGGGVDGPLFDELSGVIDRVPAAVAP